METLQWENVNRDKFAVFLRDLTENSKINLKHMIEDMYKKDEVESIKKKGKRGKGTTMKKKITEK